MQLIYTSRFRENTNPNLDLNYFSNLEALDLIKKQYQTNQHGLLDYGLTLV